MVIFIDESGTHKQLEDKVARVSAAEKPIRAGSYCDFTVSYISAPASAILLISAFLIRSPLFIGF